MALLVGFDDTDSPEGGCTTALAEPVMLLFPELRPDGAPRLVRLDPNVPWKTRGNGAVALLFDGHIDLDEALRRVVEHIGPRAMRHPGTSPGVVVADGPLDPALYDAAVARVVERDEALAAIERAGARWHGGRGVIGAAAALAWPARRTTWERIAYREPARIGTPRGVEDARVRDVERDFPSVFDSYDLVEDEVVCVPASPCPVLWGLRGEDPAALELASRRMGPERPARETLFLTNQGTDDHLRERAARDCRPLESARVRGRVATTPVERNGAVFLEVEDATGRLRAAAYAPTRGFRHVVRALDRDDEVVVCGGIHAGPDGRLTLGIEKMEVRATAPRHAGPPVCACGRSMKSAGAGAGWRCRACGLASREARTATSRVKPGWYEVPACARRHLAMPLKRATGRAVLATRTG